MTYTNSTKTFRIKTAKKNPSLECTELVFECTSYYAPIGCIYVDYDGSVTVMVNRDYLHYSQTTSNHIRYMVGWAILNYGEPYVITDGKWNDVKLNAPRLKWIENSNRIGGVEIRLY